MSVHAIEGNLKNLPSLVLARDGAALQLGSFLIPNSSLHFSGSFRTTEVGFRILVAGSISSIIMDPMRFMSARPLSGEKTLRSRIESAILATLRGQPLHSSSNAREFTDLDLSFMVQEDVAAAESTMIK